MKYDLDELNTEYVNVKFGLLTIIRVFKDDKYGIACECKCDCGNIKIAALRKLKSGHIKSCGCYNKSKEFSEYMSEIQRSNSNLISERVSNWYKNNPDKAAERATKFSKWCKNNPDRVAEIAKKNSEWCKNNPDKVKERAEKCSKLYKDNPSKSHDLGKRLSKYYTDNPEVVNRISEKCKAWRESNRDKVLEINSKISDWYKSNPDKVKEKTSRGINTYKKNRENNISKLLDRHINKRISRVENLDLSFVHPDDVHFIIDGANSHTKVRTKCPLCGKYAYHTLYVFINYANNKVIEIPTCGEHNISRPEQEVADYISTFYSGKVIKHNREIISPLELDLYYPEKKIAIEFNGDYWHSDKFKSNDYHYNKFRKCLERDIILVSVFESFWRTNSISIKSYLYDLFNSRINSLSMIDSYTMNNNYPRADIFSLSISDDYDIDSYTFSNYNIYTCGYSKIYSV